MKTFHELINESELDTEDQKDMYDGIVAILVKVKDLKNRHEIAEYILDDFKKQNFTVDEVKFLEDCKLIDKKGNFYE